MSFKAEVLADSSGQWSGNGMRFATEFEATWYADDLMSRWTQVHQTRVVPSEDDVTARVVNSRLEYWNAKENRWTR